MSVTSPFETQRRSRWVRRMMVNANSSFGHEDLPWFKRSILAIQEAGLEGEEVTSGYLKDHLIPIVGYPPHTSYMSSMIQLAIDVGVLRPTGRKARMAGRRGKSPSYMVVGRAKVDRSTNRVVLDGAHV